TPAPDFVAWRAPHEAPLRAPNAGQMPDEDEDDYLYVPLVLPDRLFENVSDNGLDLVIVADVSAATERSELELGRGVVEALAAHLDENDRIAVVASDVGLRGDAESLALGAADAGRVRGMLEDLAREPAGGATDLGATLAEAAELLDPARSGVVVYVGDGAPTVGEMGAEGLLERVQRLASPLRAYAVAIGEDSSLELLETITRGGGLATRVETRSGAAEAALRILAHARHPVAQRIEVEFEGADQVFPRRAVDVVQGAVLPIVARVDGSYGGTLHVTGEIGGEEFDETFELTEKRAFDEGDLRLRWAGERLRQLLLGGGRREEVADLGVRYGLITPFTSFYVPSAAELASLGRPAQHLWHDQAFASNRRIARGSLAMAPLIALAGTAGCDGSRSEAPASTVSGSPSPEAYDQAESEEVNIPSPAVAASPQPMNSPDETAAVEEPEAAAARMQNQREGVMGNAEQPLDDSVMDQAFGDSGGEGEAQGFGGLGLRGTGRGGGGTGEGTIGLGNLGSIGHGAGGGSGNGYGRVAPGTAMSATARPERRRRSRRNSGVNRIAERSDESDNDAIGGALLGEDSRDASGVVSGLIGGSTATGFQATLRLGVTRATHRVRHCSDAARLFLEERRNLWRERIQAVNGANAWINVYTTASRDCELPAWRDRRALLTLILNRAGSVQTMIQVHSLLSSGNARSFVRHSILRRVRTPSDLRIARNHFGRSHDRALIDQILERSGVGGGRVRALRQLVAQFPSDLDLKLMLLETLEQLGRTEQAKRLAGDLRRDPMTDPGVRTAIGEMFLRMDNEAEARRVFGEIVEFSPDDALARRRLGDLFRAHGWYEDAYRQYQTLATITPDDPSVLLLLAQAAAGAGRINEALGLEQRAAETSAPGQSQGIARTALLWSSVRFAELRQAARDEDDQDALRALASRMRRSGVLREASALRVTLVWSHPEAQLSLYGGFPGLRPTRPTDLAPEFGIEAFDVPEQEDGTYRIEVRRASAETRRGHITAQNAKLVVVWNEGGDEEKVEVINLTFEGAERVRSFEISGETLGAVNGGGQ
ncbi:MAG: tetratricopeptide (TPR) repeat protein, partial [Polyangiales bacterium]